MPRAKVVVGAFDGSKRAARRRAARETKAQRAADKEVAEVRSRLNRIYAYAQQIRTPEQLAEVLAAMPDEAQRAEFAKLLDPMLPFKRAKVVLTDGLGDVVASGDAKRVVLADG